MAKRRKRSTTKRRRKNPAKKRKASASRKPAQGYTQGTGRVRRRKLNPRRRRRSSTASSHRRVHHRRRRHNPIGGMSTKKLAILTGLAIAGGLLGIVASQQIDARVAQSPGTLGAGKMVAAGLGLLAGIKAGQPAVGLGLAAALGASGGMNLLSAFQAPAAPPTGAPPPAVPGATPPPQMAAVVDVDGDMAGHEGMAAVQDAVGTDEAGNPIFDDGYEGITTDPWSGSGAEA